MAAIQLTSLAPQPCATGMPNFCSNRFHSSSNSGAELEVTKRSFGRVVAMSAVCSLLSRILIVVGLPVAIVTP